MKVTERGPTPSERTVRRIERATGAAALLLVAITGVSFFFGLGSPVEEDELAPLWRSLRPLVADMHGTVEYRPAGGSWRPLAWSDGFSEGDEVRTGSDAYCDILLGWNVGARVQPRTEMAWRRLRREGPRLGVEVELVRGKVLSSLDHMPKGSRFEVLTTQSRTRVKGTVLEVGVDGGKTTTTVISGVVEVIDVTNLARRVEVKTGTATRFGEGGVGEITPIPPDQQGEYESALKALDAHLSHLSPSEASADAAAVSSKGQGERPGDADATAIRAVCRRGLGFLERSQVATALQDCTPGFRAIVEMGPFRVARAMGGAATDDAVEPVALELARSEAIVAASRLAEVVSLRVNVEKLDVLVDGDLAYVSGRVIVTATRSTSGHTETRPLACTARCVRQDGRWLVDLAIASEERARGSRRAVEPARSTGK